MRYLVSTKNGCTYTLDGNTESVLMYHPLYKSGLIETNRAAYDYVEWDCLDEDVYDEADRCYSVLKADSSL